MVENKKKRELFRTKFDRAQGKIERAQEEIMLKFKG
jgi:hypothetical protein